MEKDYLARFGDPSAKLDFSVTNTSARAVEITGIKTSCGCTTAGRQIESLVEYALRTFPDAPVP